MDESHEAYRSASNGWTMLKWLAAGPVLIAIGVSQAIYGWAGDSLLMRIIYSSACIGFGLALMALIGWAFFCDTEESDENPSDESG